MRRGNSGDCASPDLRPIALQRRHIPAGVAQMVEAADQSQALAPDSVFTVECQINREWTEIAEMPVRIRLGAPHLPRWLNGRAHIVRTDPPLKRGWHRYMAVLPAPGLG